jgi:hypothetical protein
VSDTPQLLLVHHLKALRLPTFLREYDKIAQQCAAEGVDHPRYLLRLAELELIERERRMVERRIKEARFPTVKSLDSFDFTFRRDAHPMAVMCGVVGALAAFYHDGLDIFDPHHRMIASHRLVAKMPTIAAMAYKYSQGAAFRLSAQRSRLPRKLPQYALFGTLRALQRCRHRGLPVSSRRAASSRSRRFVRGRPG